MNRFCKVLFSAFNTTTVTSTRYGSCYHLPTSHFELSCTSFEADQQHQTSQHLLRNTLSDLLIVQHRKERLDLNPSTFKHSSPGFAAL
ncbi:hypothetical protein E2C01_072980 [Portunus trituberculatus]|uniref:Uncharacterized protein n=1 Tax=Portunus trituberculatus TaxID=210409 RepID=A0A5B7I861_PORTR|nr:hypothetical protein [Portunus trituberculatus]